MSKPISNIKSKKVQAIVCHILDELEEQGAWIYHVSRFDSVYIKFKNTFLRTIRIADHKGRKQYRYKWNLEIKGKNSRVSDKDGIVRHYYCLEDINCMIDEIKSYNY
ncbi:MAG: hypothetical protein GOVbin8609_52 [Prokaryotic dsDNA virus sp.]|nr:MAG: hypothetical protein GOVbin8609_52 [Prokaryotic dsDNA virus sp.]